MATDTAYLDQCLGEISKLRREFGEVAKGSCIYTEEDMTWLAPSTVSPSNSSSNNNGRTTPLVVSAEEGSPTTLRLRNDALQARVELLEAELRRQQRDTSACGGCGCGCGTVGSASPPSLLLGESSAARAQFEQGRQIEELQELLEFCRREKEIAVQTLEDRLGEKTKELHASEERLRAAKEEFAEAMQSSEASNQRTRKQLQDLMASHRKLEGAIKMLTARSEPGPAEVPVDQLMDDLKVKVITLDKRIASVIANIGCWADKEHVLQRAFSEVKRLVIELKGSEVAEGCWDLSPSCFVEIPSRTRHGLLKALQELVVAWDMLPASGARYSLPMCHELATNGEYLKRLASEIRRADAVAAALAVARSAMATTPPAACAGGGSAVARSRTPINSPGEKARGAGGAPAAGAGVVVTSPAVLRRNKLAAAQTTPKKAAQREPPPLSSRLLHPSLLPPSCRPTTATAPTPPPVASSASASSSSAPLHFGCVTPEPDAPAPPPLAFRSISTTSHSATAGAAPLSRPVPRARSPATSRSSSPSLSSSRPGRSLPPSVSSTHREGGGGGGGTRPGAGPGPNPGPGSGGRAAEDASRRPPPVAGGGGVANAAAQPTLAVADRL